LIEKYGIPIGFEKSLLDYGHHDYDFDTNLPSEIHQTTRSADGKIDVTHILENNYKAVLHPITVNFENAKLEDVFNQIVRQMENYKWEINDNVVNIFPVKGRFEKFEKLLDLKISNFTFEKGKPVRDITNKFAELPEFYRFVKENNLAFTDFRNGFSTLVNAQYGRPVNAEMNFSNLTFRELLNKITKIKKGGWSLRRIRVRESGKELIEIDI
jgi:hypothetical protein